MKTFATVLLALAASTFDVPTVTADPSTANATQTDTESIALPGFDICVPADKIIWYYNTKAEGPYACTANHDTKKWSMLNAYRSGGTQGIHWKYTDDLNDSECLKDWKYYTADGQTEIATINGRTTIVNDPKRWCALPVYRPGGVYGKQWKYCICP